MENLYIQNKALINSIIKKFRYACQSDYIQVIDYHNYIGKVVRILDKDGEIFEGTIMSYDVGLEEDLDYDSIKIQPTDS